MVGRTISHYQLTDKLGAGGMGEIYKAQDTQLNRFVAIKVLAPGMSADPERRKRFFQEAQAASALNHPNIITIYDIVSDGDAQCMVMEYIAGKTLREIIPPNGMAVPQMLQYATQMAGALTAAHAAGIIHRDLKPSNVMVNASGLIKILDFGLAKWTEPASGDQATATEALTKEGSIIGTVSYMSPEQAEGKRVDARTDIFSLGSVLYEMVTGRRAFEGTSGISTLTSILRDDVKPIYELAPEVPPLLEQVIIRCLPKDPEARWRTMKEVETALLSLQRQFEPVVQPPPLPMGAASVAAAGVASSPSSAVRPPAAPVSPKTTSTAIATPSKPRPSKALALVLGLFGMILIAGALLGGWWWWTHQGEAQPQTAAQGPPVQPSAPAASTPAPEVTPSAQAPEQQQKATGKPTPFKKGAPPPKSQLSATPGAPEAPRPAAEEPPPPPKRVQRAPAVQLTPVAVGDALPFRIVLADDVPVDAQEGQALRFTVADGLQVEGNTVVAKGAGVTGSIIGEAGKKKFLGFGGKMTFRLLQAETVDGKRINVRATAGKRKDGPTVRTFDTGKNPKTKGLAAMQGTEYIGYIDGEQTVAVKK